MYITAQGCRLRNDLYCVEWDVKLYYTIPTAETLIFPEGHFQGVFGVTLLPLLCFHLPLHLHPLSTGQNSSYPA